MVNIPLIEALDKSLSRLGLGAIVKSYLSSAFDAEDLRSVKPRDLPRALRFISDLQDMVIPSAVRRQQLPSDLKADGGLIVVNGHVEIGADAPKTEKASETA